jgi:predicted outer membrane repeat protein
VPAARNTVIDGGGKVTLDGGGRTRIIEVNSGNYRVTHTGLTLQHIALVNGKAVGTRYVAPSASNASCSFGWADGAGGAIYVRDAVLHAIDVTFRNNAAETPGPDVGGGAIYALGSVDVAVVGSTFDGNSGANGGAVGLLQSDGRFYNSLFSNNKASGTGANYVGGAAQGCSGLGANQGGSGGNGGAISIDGASDVNQTVCGSTFTANTGGAFGGALFRTADGLARPTTFDRSVFQGNHAQTGGALYVQNAKPLSITASTFSGNVAATSAGAGDFISSQLQITNSTFAGNIATRGVGGALSLSNASSAGWLHNDTFSGNQSVGGPGYFSAAIFGAMPFTTANNVFANNTTSDTGSPMQCFFTPGIGTDNAQWPQKRVAGGLNDNPCVSGIRFVDPQLGALGNNGGPTPTIAPSAASPLRKSAHNCPATDQRGVARNTALCTAGAVE